VIEGASRRILGEADGGSGIGLGIAVNEESGLIGGTEAGGQVHRCRGFAYATFLICYGNDSGQTIPRERKSSKSVARMQDVSRGTGWSG